jgi:hypothetical protein
VLYSFILLSKWSRAFIIICSWVVNFWNIKHSSILNV